MSRLLWLPEALKEAGLEVRAVDGWRTRGADTMTPQVVVGHHTASTKTTSPDRMAAFLARGSSDLAGPLSQLGLDRNGVYWLIASGRANHAGRGSWRGVTGNSNAIGIEAYNDGRGEPWPDIQLDAYDRGVAAILRRIQRDETWFCGHREWAPGRKIDPFGIDLDDMRARIAGHLLPQPQLTQAEVKKLRDLIWAWESVGSNPSFPIYTIEHTRRHRT